MGALVVQLVESWVYDPEETDSNPRAGGRKNNKKYSSPPVHPSVKRVHCTWSCTRGAQHTDCVSLSTNGSGGTN